jgi:hypothetical protein
MEFVVKEDDKFFDLMLVILELESPEKDLKRTFLDSL